MSVLSVLSSKPYKRFMSMLYGLGASVVIIGALFKIVHIEGANQMLFIGLITEAVIFFFSAFEPPHVEPDWSLVYPELSGMYHSEGEIKAGGRKKAGAPNKTVTQELDEMLDKAKIGPELIESLGQGMRAMSENVKQLSNVSNAALATDQFVKNVSDAGKSAQELSGSYKKVSDILNQDATSATDFSNSMKTVASSAGSLATAYTEVAGSIKKEMAATEKFNTSIASASETFGKLAENYNKAIDLINKSAEKLDSSATSHNSYQEQLQKVSKNLSALNALYELQMNTATQQTEATEKLRKTVDSFVSNLSDSSTNMAKYKEEVDNLTKRVSALNQVYGNMLAAMNYSQK